jgi:hypothetical protein
VAVVKDPALWFILASGPSQNFDDIKAIQGRGTVLAVNNTIFSAPWADLVYAADAKWWEVYGPRLRTYTGRKLSISKGSRNYGATEIVKPGPRNAQGLGEMGCVKLGGNSGYQAINVAYNEGAERIVLLGFDCGYTFGRRHYHEDHPRVRGLGNADGVEFWRARFPALAADLRDKGVQVVNCSRYTTLDCFERMDLETYLDQRA